jgi:hypothetical protein
VSLIRQITLLAALAGMIFAASGCKTAVPPFRTLPANIQTVYIPMVENYTFEPAIEEIATKTIQKRFMTDGRLRVTDRRDADIVVLVKLMDFASISTIRGNDDISVGDEVSVRGEVLIFLKGAEEPFGQFEDVQVSSLHGTDTRRSIYRPEPVWKDELFRLYADEVVSTVISGDYSGKDEPKVPTSKLPPLPSDSYQKPGRGIGVGF